MALRADTEYRISEKYWPLPAAADTGIDIGIRYRAVPADTDTQYRNSDIRRYQPILVSMNTTSGDLATARGPYHLFNLCEDPRVRVRAHLCHEECINSVVTKKGSQLRHLMAAPTKSSLTE